MTTPSWKTSRDFTSRREEAIEKRSALILEFYKAAPGHEKIPALMFERWDTLITLGKGSPVENEIHQVLATSSNAKLKREAAFERVRLEINDAARSGILPVQHINEYIKLERKLKSEDVRGPLVLWMASKQVRDDEARLEIENRIRKEFPPRRLPRDFAEAGAAKRRSASPSTSSSKTRSRDRMSRSSSSEEELWSSISGRPGAARA